MSVKISKYPGVGLKEEDIKGKKVLTTVWPCNLKYSWSAGVAVGRFLTELKNGKIIGRVCKKCGRILIPPRMYCEWCWKPTDEWVYVKDTGTINTYAITHLATDGVTRLKEPMPIAVIQLDVPAKLPRFFAGFLHYLGEVKPEDVKFGMKVKAVWKPPEERVGSITDIKYFKPV